MICDITKGFINGAFTYATLYPLNVLKKNFLETN